MGLQQKTLELIEMAKEVLNGKPRYLRSIYYAMEARQMIEASPKTYQRLKYALTEARKQLLINPGLIKVGRDRQTMSRTPNVWGGPDVVRAAQEAYSLYERDWWKDQESYIEVWVEKISLCDDFLPFCRKYGVLLVPCKGDQSLAAIWDAKQRLDEKLTVGKKVKILYFGDFNPSGVHAPVAIQNTLSDWGTGGVEFQRIALMFEDIQKYNLPPNPTKKTTHKDKVLAQRFIQEYGEDWNVELDSLVEHAPQDFLSRIEEAIKAEIDFDLKAENDQKVARAQARLKRILANKLRWE